MKKSIKILLLLFTIGTLSTNMVFAQSTVTPMVGMPVGLEHDPSDIAMPSLKTDANGKIACELKEGKYRLNISYSQIERILSNKRLLMSNVEISLLMYSKSTNAKENSIAKTSADKESGALSINIPKGGALISGIISYELKK